MDDADAAVVLARAEQRATALATADAAGLRALLHPEFRWTTHVGEVLDRETYIASNTTGRTVWHGQTLVDPGGLVVDDYRMPGLLLTGTDRAAVTAGVVDVGDADAALIAGDAVVTLTTATLRRRPAGLPRP